MRKHRRTVADSLPTATPLTDSFIAQLIDTQRNTLLHEAIDSLPENWRHVVLMSLDGVPGKDIAARLGVTLDSVKATKTRATARLRELLPVELRPEDD